MITRAFSIMTMPARKNSPLKSMLIAMPGDLPYMCCAAMAATPGLESLLSPAIAVSTPAASLSALTPVEAPVIITVRNCAVIWICSCLSEALLSSLKPRQAARNRIMCQLTTEVPSGRSIVCRQIGCCPNIGPLS